jgi:hypothetical protein
LTVKPTVEGLYSMGVALKAPPEQYQPAVQSPTGEDNPSKSQYFPAERQCDRVNEQIATNYTFILL